MNFKTIYSKIEESKPVDFGVIFDSTIEIFKKTWQYGFLFFMSYIGIAFVLAGIIILPLMAMGFLQQVIDYRSFEGLSIATAMLMIFVILFVILTILVSAMGLLAGLYLVYKKADRNEPYSTSDLFSFLNRKHFKPLLKLALVQMGISLLALLLCYLPIIYVSIPLHFLIVFYAFHPNLSTREIVELSFKIGNKNWLMAFLLVLVFSFIASFGMLLCFIGYFFTMALVIIPFYSIYKEAVPFDSQDELEEIGESIERI